MRYYLQTRKGKDLPVSEGKYWQEYGKRQLSGVWELYPWRYFLGQRFGPARTLLPGALLRVVRG
jgi:hypothetical protein